MTGRKTPSYLLVSEVGFRFTRMSRYSGNRFAELHRANGRDFGGHFRRAHQTVHSVLVAAVLSFRLWAKWRQSDFFPAPLYYHYAYDHVCWFCLNVSCSRFECMCACVRARVRYDSFLIELSSCLKTVRFSSTFFHGTFEWCVCLVSFISQKTHGRPAK